MRYIKNAWLLFDNYVLARWQNRPSTAGFWYLPEPPAITSKNDLVRYQQSQISPSYLIDYSKKLNYSLTNAEGIIVLPYQHPIGAQINPEAAFQYALGLHDQYLQTKQTADLNKFLNYASLFQNQQSAEGLWPYQFDWYGSKAPWYSALAQARGASVMLRAWKLTQDEKYYKASTNSLKKFMVPISEGGFLHTFSAENCLYFEEYPHTPTGVINGFMSSLMNIWELNYWLKEPWLTELWQTGIQSLEKMLPHYSNGWWSLYDLDPKSPIANVNSPRYHQLEIDYLHILALLSDSDILINEKQKRIKQCATLSARMKAVALKCVRKILYR